MSQLPGYKTGGTIHFVINNQIGFTTDFDDADLPPIAQHRRLWYGHRFFVNGDDPEAVVFASELATEYRQKFHPMFTWHGVLPRHGHNEGDDPKFTQPKMYDLIATHPDPRNLC